MQTEIVMLNHEIKKKILLFPAGTEIAFEIVNALKYSKFVELYAGTSTTDHSEFMYKNLITGFPYIEEAEFIRFLNKQIHKYHIDCIYPAHDDVCLYFSEHADEIDAQVIITEYKTTSICRSKKATYQYFQNEDFIPSVFASVRDVRKYPVFVKPDIGQGAVGAVTADSEMELTKILENREGLIICEYLPGKEYTIDCFTDRFGRLRVSKLRSRERMRAGISVRSREIPIEMDIRKIADSLNNKLKFRGAWFFQIKKDADGRHKLLEVSPRIPGTMGLSRNMGINFPMLTLFDFWGYDIELIDNQYDIRVDRALYSAYKIDYTYTHIYLDFDDTLIIRDRVNAEMMRFLYQASGEGKKIHLLSRHAGDLRADLQKYRISEKLFDEIVVISALEEKSDYIKESSAVFIDDSFSERRKVQQNVGIPVFDVDMVESLIDWRV